MKTLITILLGATVITIILIGFAKNAEKNALTQTMQSPTSKLARDINPIKRETNPLLTTVATGLRVPWGLAFLPNGTLLATERNGNVRIIRKDLGLEQNILLSIQEVKEIGEGGLLGLAIHPDYPKKPYVYFYYTYKGNNTNSSNRLVRFTLQKEKFSGPQVLIDNIPAAANHDGGRIKFGPDKNLYITTGDSQTPSLAQNRNSLAGKILRVTDEGKPVQDNPFANAGGNPLVYSYGHRNPQGLAWDTSGNLWETEHGRSNPTGFDELNIIESGKNYGWPTIQGDETKPTMVTPIINSGPDTTWAPSGVAFVNGSLFFSGLKGQALYEAVIKNNKVAELKEHFKNQFGRLREVILGPDNMLYLTTSNRDGRGSPSTEDDRIIKINPKKL